MTHDKSEAGLGDPYWYEWSIGQGYLIDMLDARSGIASVTLQQEGTKGLDDVVVRYANGAARFIQVKHTRVADTLTFGDLVAKADDGSSLLGSIAAAWATESTSAPNGCEAWLVTNRSAGARRSSTTGATPVDRPPLDQFLPHLAREVSRASTLADIAMTQEWENAWTTEWLACLDLLASDAERLKFLRAFHVRTSELGLPEIEDQLVQKLRTLFAVDHDAARRLLDRLDSALRTWTTSVRGTAQAVAREAVYAKLCLVLDEAVGEHGLAPPAPFFASRVPACDDLCRDLASRSAPIVFVTGSPGSGKTAVISHLANRREPVIDARFHAYRPITPDNQLLPADAGRTTTSRALWSDLLIQIRAGLRDRLASLDVPVHAASLSVDSLRAHVLRLANVIGAEQGRPFVIAIDGIDHAARSGTPTASFLASLVGPDAVPPHVAFVVGGQPPDAYADYPAWLRVPTSGVQRLDLPGVPLDDTLMLVRARIPRALAEEQENAARDIWERCQGNTLSTVFAVEEAALLEHDLGALASHLDQRQLATGVESYYRVIWDAAVHAAGIQHVTAARLAASLCLLPVRATGAMVRDALGIEAGGVTETSDLLRQLRPLIVEEHGGFRVFHNDVRVFLLRVLRAEPGVFEECAGRIADHLMQGANVAARHAAAQDLYGKAGRRREQAALFTPAYVLDGHVVGRSVDALTEQALVAADVLTTLDADWDLAHAVATGLRTVQQLRASLGWRDADVASHGSPAAVGTRSAERRVLPRAGWTSAAVMTVLEDLSDLLAAGERARAEAAYRRWFAGMSPATIAEDLGLAKLGGSAHTEREAVHTALTGIGRLSVTLWVRLPDSTGELANEAEACFAAGLLHEAVDCHEPRDFLALLGRVRRYYLRDVQRLVSALVDTRAWLRCKLLLRRFGPKDADPWSFRLQIAACASLLGGAALRAACVTPVLLRRSAMLTGAAAHTGGIETETQPLTVMAWTAFLLGLEDPQRDASAVREEVEAPYRRSTRDERHDSGVAQILHAAALAGSLAAATRRKRPLATHVDAQTVARTAAVLMTALDGKHYMLPHGFPLIANKIVRCLAECAQHHPAIHGALAAVMLRRVEPGVGPSVFLETVWRSLAPSGARAALVAYADAWVGPQGRAWNEAPAERYDLVRRMATLLDEIDEGERARAARDQLPWGDIGYTGHKEVVLGDPFAWFEALTTSAPSAWETDGLRLLALSREASRTGDNRLSWEVDDAVLTAACMCGPDSLRRLVARPNAILDADDRAILSGLLGSAKQVRAAREDLLGIWSLAIGQLCWQVDRDRGRLVEVRDALVALAHEMGLTDLPDLMARAAPAEFAAQRDKDEQAPVADTPAPNTLHAMRSACRAGDWKSIARVLEGIDAGTIDGAQMVGLALQALQSRPVRVWWWDGAGPAYTATFPRLSPSQRWGLLVTTLRGSSTEEPESRLHTLSELLDDLCRLAAAAHGETALRDGLRRLLEMHELWLSGNGRLAKLAALPLPVASTDEVSWRRVFVDLLIHLLEVDYQAYIQAALRGLHQLLAVDPTLYPYAVARIDRAEPTVQRRFLFVADALAAHGEAEALRAWLAAQVRSPRIDVALTAWSALRFAALARNESEPDWPTADDDPDLVRPVSAPLLDRPIARTGIHTSAGRASTAVLAHLRAACGEVDDLRSELAASVRDDPPHARADKTGGRHVGDMIVNAADEAELDRLFSIMRARERKGRFEGTSRPELAQALVPFVDPFVFLTTPRTRSVAADWPIEDQLDGLVQAGQLPLEATLAACAEADLPASVRLIAAAVRTFSRQWDVLVRVDHVVCVGFDHGEDERPSVLNGRSALLADRRAPYIARPGARDQEWLTQEVAGLMPCVDATLDFFPGRCWRARFGWQPDPRDPHVWLLDGHRVAWFERLCGPVRHDYVGDYVYRQPTVARWVCRSDEWNRIGEELGAPHRRLRSEVGRHRAS